MHDLPDALRRELEKEVEAVSFPELAEVVTRLREAYRSERVDRTPRLDSPVAALGYAAYRMPGTYAAIRTVLARAVESIPGLDPRTVVDLGGGTGAGAWAVAAAWPNVGTITIHDRSHAATDLGRRLAASGPAAVAATTWVTGPLIMRADVATAGYLLGELTDSERVELVAALIGHSDTVIVVEPGTTAGYHRILEVRRLMIEAGMAIASPCPHTDQCPLAGRDWCHFAARFSRSPTLRRLKAAEHGHDDEKFSYVVGTRLPAVPAPGRVIRHPQKRTGLVLLQLCDADGTAHPVTVSKRHGARYRAARDTRWGDPWPPK